MAIQEDELFRRKTYEASVQQNNGKKEADKPWYQEALAEHGIDLKVLPEDDGTTTIVSNFGGFRRTMQVSPAHEVRLVADPSHLKLLHGDGKEPRPVLAVIDPNKSIGIGKLAYVPVGVSTDQFLAPKNSSVDVAPELVAQVEATTKARMNGHVDPLHFVEFGENEDRPDPSLQIGGKYLVRKNGDKFEWFSPKTTKIKRAPLAEHLKEQGLSPDAIEDATKTLRQAPVLVERARKPKNEINPDGYIETAITSNNEDVAQFLKTVHSQKIADIKEGLEDTRRAAETKSRVRRALHETGMAELAEYDITEQALAVAAAADVNKIRRDVLTEVGRQYSHDIPFDLTAQAFLPRTRAEVEELTIEQVGQKLAAFLKPSDKAHYERTNNSTEIVQREEVSWLEAQEQAKNALIKLAEQNATAEELAVAYERMKRPVRPLSRDTVFMNQPINVVDEQGKPLSPNEIFPSQGRAPLSVEEYCSLPTRPLVLPIGEPERGVNGLATFIFDNILYSPQLCDREGLQVGLTPETRKELIDKVAGAINRGEPISASEYTPLGAIANPLKRNTQKPALADLDFLRRLAETSHAVEMFYPQGLKWVVGNEVPAFTGPEMLNLDPEYADRFHKQCEDAMRMIDPEGRRLSMIRMDELLWGTPERRQAWEAYQRGAMAEMREAYDDVKHPKNTEVRQSIDTFTFPMATCTNPFQFDSARGMGTKEIAQVYAALKQVTRSEIRGVNLTTEEGIGVESLTGQQRDLLEQLILKGQDMAFNYRVTMAARNKLPAFTEAVPDHTIAYTMVTKYDKPVLFPNSRRGAYFPAHGEPVQIPSSNPQQRTSVTVRPFWQIAAQREKYTPMYTEGREEPLYYKENN